MPSGPLYFARIEDCAPSAPSPPSTGLFSAIRRWSAWPTRNPSSVSTNPAWRAAATGMFPTILKHHCASVLESGAVDVSRTGSVAAYLSLDDQYLRERVSDIEERSERLILKNLFRRQRPLRVGNAAPGGTSSSLRRLSSGFSSRTIDLGGESRPGTWREGTHVLTTAILRAALACRLYGKYGTSSRSQTPETPLLLDGDEGRLIPSIPARKRLGSVPGSGSRNSWVMAPNPPAPGRHRHRDPGRA